MRPTLVVFLILGGCGQDDVLSSFGGDDDGFRTRVSSQHLEVGVAEAAGERCTAILVTPYAILTGAGCVADPDDLGVFRPGAGSTAADRTYAIDAVESFGEEVDGSTIVLAHLTEAVPGTIRPARLADREPAAGERVERYGYDCTRVGDATPIKRVQTFRWGDRIEACPSGVTLRADGSVFQLEGGPLADVASWYAELREQVYGWPAPLERAGADGLVASWSFDDGYEAGVDGPAASFDGKATIARPRPLLAHRTEFTWSAWIRPRSPGALYTEGDPEMTLGILLREDGSLAFTAYHWASREPWMTGASDREAVPWGTWSQITITLEGGGPGQGTVRFHVNGRAAGVASVQASANPWTSLAALGDEIGASWDADSTHVGYVGELDEVRIYDRASDPERGP